MQERMDWRHMAFDWNHVRALLATADEGSYTAAAKVLRTTQPTIGRQIAAFEEELGVVLFEKRGRRVVPTPTGVELVAFARVMADAAFRLGRVAAGQSVELEGVVRISAGEVAAAHLLPPIVAEIRKRHPGIVVEIQANNAVSDLGLREADIALRNFRPKDDELVAKKVRESKGYLYATPEYLSSIGDPKDLEELAERAAFIAFDESNVFLDGLRAMGLPLRAESFPFVSASQHVQRALIVQGAAIGVGMPYQFEGDPVVRVMPEQIAFPVATWLTSHREVRTSRRVRVVYDMLAEALA